MHTHVCVCVCVRSEGERELERVGEMERETERDTYTHMRAHIHTHALAGCDLHAVGPLLPNASLRLQRGRGSSLGGFLLDFLPHSVFKCYL